MHAIDDFLLFRIGVQEIRHMDFLNDQYILLILAYHAPYVRREVGGYRGYVARFQRAGKGAGQSTGCRCHDEVNCRVSFAKLFRVHAVMFGNGSVYTELHRLFIDRHVSQSIGAFLVLDFDVRYVISLFHDGLLQ